MLSYVNFDEFLSLIFSFFNYDHQKNGDILFIPINRKDKEDIFNLTIKDIVEDKNNRIDFNNDSILFDEFIFKKFKNHLKEMRKDFKTKQKSMKQSFESFSNSIDEEYGITQYDPETDYIYAKEVYHSNFYTYKRRAIYERELLEREEKDSGVTFNE